jgi:hypothetical protein
MLHSGLCICRGTRRTKYLEENVAAFQVRAGTAAGHSCRVLSTLLRAVLPQDLLPAAAATLAGAVPAIVRLRSACAHAGQADPGGPGHP